MEPDIATEPDNIPAEEKKSWWAIATLYGFLILLTPPRERSKASLRDADQVGLRELLKMSSCTDVFRGFFLGIFPVLQMLLAMLEL